MTADELISDAVSLDVSDRLRIAEAIWDSLPEGTLPAPGHEVKGEFDCRMEDYRQDPESGMTLGELRDRLDADKAR
ncbi:MAG: addiction module protein [Planctomycetota bacterium]